MMTCQVEVLKKNNLHKDPGAMTNAVFMIHRRRISSNLSSNSWSGCCHGNDYPLRWTPFVLGAIW